MMDIIPLPNIEIESKYFRETNIPAYSIVLSAYVYTYVALHICWSHQNWWNLVKSEVTAAGDETG